MEAIETLCDSEQEEWMEYYISFLKSLSIRIAETQISVFYNKVNIVLTSEKLYLSHSLRSNEIFQPSRFYGQDQCYECYSRTHEK